MDAVDTGLSGRGDLLGALREYEKRRNEASKPDYWQNLNAARFIPPPDELFRIRGAVRGNQEMTTRFFLANEGMIQRDAFSTRRTWSGCSRRRLDAQLAEHAENPGNLGILLCGLCGLCVQRDLFTPQARQSADGSSA